MRFYCISEGKGFIGEVAEITIIRSRFLTNDLEISGVQISFRPLTKVGVTSKFWFKLINDQ